MISNTPKGIVATKVFLIIEALFYAVILGANLYIISSDGGSLTLFYTMSVICVGFLIWVGLLVNQVFIKKQYLKKYQTQSIIILVFLILFFIILLLIVWVLSNAFH